MPYSYALSLRGAGDSAGARTAERTVEMENCQGFVTGQGNPAYKTGPFEELFGRQLEEHKTLCLVLWLMRISRQLQFEL